MALSDYAESDPIHAYATLADAEALTMSRFNKDTDAIEASLSAVKPLGEIDGKYAGPKTVGHQVPVPKHFDPMSGLKCSKCGKQAVGFIVTSTFKPPKAQSAQEAADEAERRLADSLYGAIDGNDLELASKYGMPLERLAHGLHGPKPVASLAPQPHSLPMCRVHFNQALTANAPEKPSEPLGVEALDEASHWNLLPGHDSVYCTVRDKHGTTARITPRDYKEHTGVWPGR